MPVNPNIESPTLSVPMAFDSVDQTFGSGGGGATLRGVDVWGDGTLHIADVTGRETTRDFTDLTKPVRWVIQIRKIFTDSTLLSANVDGLI